MDPIHPIAPGPVAFPRTGSLPVERLERLSRERDRPRREKRQPGRDEPPAGGQDEPPEDDGRPHIDVRA